MSNGKRAATVLFMPLRQLFDLVLPPRCPSCRVIVDGDDRFCSACYAALQFISAPLCACCGIPLVHDGGPDTLCGGCLAEPPNYATARAAFVYAGPARSVVLSFKHGDRQHLARLMAPHLLRASVGGITADSLVVPVPLHRWRLWERGFNQAALMATQLARLSGAKTCLDAMQRVKPSRKGPMDRAARRKNVAGAFRVRDKSVIAGRHILLIDDVMTSGATAAACARALKRAGATRVDVLTWARAVRVGDDVSGRNAGRSATHDSREADEKDSYGQG